MQPLDSVISEGAWDEFQQNICWRAVVHEIVERDKVLMASLRYRDDTWTDDQIRARINELEFVLTIPQAMVAEIRLMNQNKTNNEDKEKGE